MPHSTYAYVKLRDSGFVAESTRRSMYGNRAADTKPEVALRKALWAAGIRGYRKNVKKLPGKPDVVFGPARLAIFVHGCFWHQCPTCTRTPKTNARYWAAKFAANVERDERNQAALERAGYQVLVIWECELKRSVAEVVERVRFTLPSKPANVIR